MIILYPSGNEVKERYRVSLFVDARLGESESDFDNGFDSEDIFLRKPFGYWIKSEGVVVYSGSHWSEANYGDYFWDNARIKRRRPTDRQCRQTRYRGLFNTARHL